MAIASTSNESRITHYATAMMGQIGIDKATGNFSPASVKAAAARFIAEALDEDRAASADELRQELSRVRGLLRDAFHHVRGNGRRAAAQGQGWQTVVDDAKELAVRIAAEIGDESGNLPGEHPEWIAQKWVHRSQLLESSQSPMTRGILNPIIIEEARSPFYEGVRFAVRWMGRCLTREVEWEFEPQPSSRDEAFYERCRFMSFEEAAGAAEGKLSGEA